MTAYPDLAETISSLSQLEKASLLSGENTWETRAIPRLGVRSLFLSDGPHGLRKQVGPSDHLGLNGSQPSTCFPTAATVANSWDPELGEKIGEALGREAAHIGVDVVLGPGLNVKRSPLGGRNFEYFSEDPYLAGKIAAAYVRGIQAMGVGACPKHFAVNSQETLRMVSNSVVDERTLREIYLTAFEIVVRESDPHTIMTSYNLLGGIYTNENAHLLQEILRDEWGFDGLVVTDWGGGNDPVAAIAAGGTVEMPSPGFESAEQIIGASNLDQTALEARVAEVIRLTQAIDPVKTDESIYEAHTSLAQEVAEQSIVLLKNDEGILPLGPGTRVAVVGDFAFTPRYQGAGSSLVNPTSLVAPIDALHDSELLIQASARGFERGKPADAALIAEAVAAAKDADVVLLYLGLDEFAESEGKDRDHMLLPGSQLELLGAISDANPRVVVVFAAGSAVEAPWVDRAQALVHGYLSGQAGATAMVRVLTGEVNPSGHLAETYPMVLGDTPTAGRFPARGKNALYREGPYVGYRYYSSADIPVRFPFGFGLSYTEFAYDDIRVDAEGVSFTLSNIGSVAGSEVAQVYVSAPAEAADLGPMPRRELKGFRKVHLDAGESREVRIDFDAYTFRHFDAVGNRWVIVQGDYQIAVGRNVADLPLHQELFVAGSTVDEASAAARIDGYVNARVHDVTDKDFSALLGHPLPVEPSTERSLGWNSPLADLGHAKSPLARAIHKHYFLRGLKKAEEKGKPDLNLLFLYNMPFRAISKMGGGMADRSMVDGILTIVNGHFFRGVGQVIGRFFANRRRQKALRAEFARLSTQPVVND